MGQPRTSLEHLGLGPLWLVEGDLAAERADVLVNEANNTLSMTGGVGGALRARGGMAIHTEAIAMAPLPMGRVVRTGAGDLEARFVYHAITKDYDLNRGLSGKVVTAVVEESLMMAAEDGAESLCLPLFGEGGGSDLFGLEMPLVALVEGLESAGRDKSSSLEICIVVRDPDEHAQALELLLGMKAGKARENEESQLAEDYLAQLMAEMGDVSFE
ncbi:MAG: macro domain-containing protein [Deltaproteobacteria bacterium]|nr:macro domain-containing protein [Deltaproteobacteria bacterium]